MTPSSTWENWTTKQSYSG